MFKNIEELKNRIINYLKDIIKNENNKNAIELINKSGYLAAEAHGQIKVYTDKEKSKSGSLHLAYCEILGADGRENNRQAKQFIKDNTIQSLLSAAVEEVKKDNLKLNQAESTKYLLIDLQDKINNYFNSLSIKIENINVRFSDHNIEYYLNFNSPIGDEYFNIYFKLQGNQYLYNDTYKEEKHIFKNVEEILKHFINEISPAVQKKISFLKMYSIVENNFKNNIDKKILFKNKDSFYTATIDNQYITLYEVNRKKEKPVYNYLYLKQFIDLFIKDNIDKFIVIDNNTDLSIKNLRNLTNSNNCIMIHEEAATDREENKNSLGAENMNTKRGINNKRYFKATNPGHKDFIVIDKDNAIIKHLEGSKVWKTEEKDIIKNLGHKDVDAYIKHLKKFNYIEVKEDIKEEFYKKSEEEKNKENLKLIFDTIESKIDNCIELVDDIEYFEKFIDGIVVYFPNGEAYQIFIDIDNKTNNNNTIIVLDENINILYNSNDINYIIDNVINSVEEKNNYINNSKKYINL